MMKSEHPSARLKRAPIARVFVPGDEGYAVKGRGQEHGAQPESDHPPGEMGRTGTNGRRRENPQAPGGNEDRGRVCGPQGHPPGTGHPMHGRHFGEREVHDDWWEEERHAERGHLERRGLRQGDESVQHEHHVAAEPREREHEQHPVDDAELAGGVTAIPIVPCPAPSSGLRHPQIENGAIRKGAEGVDEQRDEAQRVHARRIRCSTGSRKRFRVSGAGFR